MNSFAKCLLYKTFTFVLVLELIREQFKLFIYIEPKSLSLQNVGLISRPAPGYTMISVLVPRANKI